MDSDSEVEDVSQEAHDIVSALMSGVDQLMRRQLTYFSR